ncbi:MAG: hypothetical protein ABI759_30830 [Candidatus Solibacter sp.]
MRESILRAAVLAGVAVVAITELLSPLHLLRWWTVAAAWLLAAALIARQLPRPQRARWRPVEGTLALLTVAVAAVVALVAILSPPNSADAMAYHLPRVVYWAQSGSVAFFPTPYLNQIMLQPLAEYFMLHTYLLSGGDRLINVVAFGAYLGSIVGVAAIAQALGLGTRAQAWAALFCATLPNAILQGSGAKNDFLLAFYLVCAVYFTARRNAPYAALAAALALATKGTAYLFLPPVLVYAAAVLPRRRLLWIPAAACLINGPQYARNLQLSGSPLGFDSAQANGVFRWRNEHLTWRPLVSNALRHLSEQLGMRSPAWNQAVYQRTVRLHQALGLDAQDGDTTWPGARFEPPRNANHEANANSHWQLLLLLAAALAALFARNRVWTLYAAGLLAAFLLFCWYLKYQPFLARLELPLFVAAAPLAAYLVDRLRHPAVALVLGLFLVNNARPALFENWTRPLKGPRSLFATTRNDNYFSDMGQWDNKASYVEAVDRLARSGCTRVGLDISENQLEYPVQVLLRQRVPGAWFVHTGVTGPSAKYADGSERTVCAVLCPDCTGNDQKRQLYGNFGVPLDIGRFWLFVK